MTGDIVYWISLPLWHWITSLVFSIWWLSDDTKACIRIRTTIILDNNTIVTEHVGNDHAFHSHGFNNSKDWTFIIEWHVNDMVANDGCFGAGLKMWPVLPYFSSHSTTRGVRRLMIERMSKKIIQHLNAMFTCEPLQHFIRIGHFSNQHNATSNVATLRTTVTQQRVAQLYVYCEQDLRTSTHQMYTCLQNTKIHRVKSMLFGDCLKHVAILCHPEHK